MARTLLCYLLCWIPLVWLSNVRPLVVLGSSMEPALRPGQVVVLHRDYYRTHRLERGHMVAFRWGGKLYVKRVHALDGDAVDLICQQGYCLPVAGEEKERAVRLSRSKRHFSVRSVSLPADCFFSLGDHLPASVDSRDLGPIPTSAIIGRVQPLWRGGL